MSEYAHRLYADRRARGLCGRCGKVKSKRSKCDKCLELQTKHTKELDKKNKQIVYEHYGNRCACCGESNPLFLSLDHVNNDAYLWREEGIGTDLRKLMKWIIRNNFPSTIQLLCFNCNMGKARNKGVCPHKTRR